MPVKTKPQPTLQAPAQEPYINRVRTNTEELHACNIPPLVYDILMDKTRWLRARGHVKIKDVLDDILQPIYAMDDTQFRAYLKEIEPLLVSHPGRDLGWKRVYIAPEIQLDLKHKLIRHGAMDDREQVGNTTKGVHPSIVIAATIVADSSKIYNKCANN